VSVHRCDICGKDEEWSRQWAWWGSYRELEYHGDNAVLYTCSDACREAAGDRIKTLRESKAKAYGCAKTPKQGWRG
jgi:hypothetical protein